MAFAGIGKRAVSVRQKAQRNKELKRELSRRMQLETLEGRQLMAVGPQLIGVQSSEGELLQAGSVLNVSPRELVFRFDDGAAIDGTTFSGIQLTRAGQDGIFDRAYVSSDLGTGGAVVLDFAAAVPGRSGNGIEIQFTRVTRTDSSMPRVQVTGQLISIEVNTAAGLKTTAQNLLDAINNDSAASALILATRLRGSQFAVIADTVPTTRNLTLSGANSARASTNMNAGASLQVEFVAQTAGPVGRDVRIVVTSSDKGGPSLPVVSVSGTTITVDINSNSRNATTVQEFVDAINGNTTAASLVLARIVSGSTSTRVGALSINYSPIRLTGATDIPVIPAFVGYGDSNREVIFRFAEELPDDIYRVDILGRGTLALRNVAGEPFNGGVDKGFQFELDLGAKILSVVPQPVVRLANGTLEQRRNQIHVYFNNDDLNVASAENPAFYQLRYTNGTINANDDIIAPAVLGRVEYDPDLDLAILTYNRNLDELSVAGNPLPIQALRLRIGTDESTLAPPTTLAPVADPGSRFDTALDITGSFNPSSALPKSIVISSEIRNTTPYIIDFPGANDEPGNRNIRYQQHVTTVDADGIEVIEYNFQGQLGTANGSVQLNAITEVQKTRVREIMSLYANYLGVRFIETSARGFTVAVGDMRAVVGGGDNAPGGAKLAAGVLASNGQPAVVVDIQDFNSASENQFGTDLFRSFMQGIGVLLGLGSSEELPNLTVQSNQPINQPGIATEMVFPGNADIVHGQFVHRPEGKDIDLYRFQLPESGLLKIETFAERLQDSSLLDTVLRLYKLQPDGSFLEISSNDNYFSQDSLVRIQVSAGTYVLGVSAEGNRAYDPNIEDSGLGGRSEGRYQVRLDFRPPEQSFMVDDNNDGNGSDVRIDGDADGKPGGAYDFWFIPSGPSNTLYVDKASAATTSTGTIAAPFKTIREAMQAATSGKVVRIVGNGGADGLLSTTSDNLAYELGFNRFGQVQADGASLDVPKDVTVMVDAGAILKLNRSRISVGSSSVSVDRSGGTLQVLGVPRLMDTFGNVIFDANGDAVPGSVYFTSLHENIGRGVNADRTPPAAAPGDWGGIDFRNQIDGSDQGRRDWEREGLFLNSIVHADIRFGGGQVVVDGVSQVITPIHMVDSRPTIANSIITRSADAAMAATPNSFRESNFQDPRSQLAGLFIADYDRVGPDIHGNRVVNNTINGLFVKVRTSSASATEVLAVSGRFDDTDIAHVITENLVVAGTPGGPIQDSSTPPTAIVSLASAAGGSLAAGNYNYKLVYVDALGNESPASEETATITLAVPGSIVINGLPPIRSDLPFTNRRIYRSSSTGTGPYQFVAQINAISTTFTDNGSVTGGVLVESPARLRPRLDGSLTIDPNTIVKLQGARIELSMGGQLIAEGIDGQNVIFTSLDDVSYGAGGTFDTANRRGTRGAAVGDWGGIYAGQTSTLAMDYSRVSFAGGTTRIDGGFASFNPVEIHQAEARIAHSRFENNANGGAGAAPTNRAGRGTNFASTIFVRGAQPILVENRIAGNLGPAINIDVNSLNQLQVDDVGRSSGEIGRVGRFIDNNGPLIVGNTIGRNQINGMVVRGQTLTTRSIWDDTDIVHVVFDTISSVNTNVYGGLRLESKPNESLVVKFQGSANRAAGLNATGIPLDFESRVGGSIQIVGQPGYPVILTSLTDDSAGAGFTPEGFAQTDTDNSSTAGSDSGIAVLPTGPEVDNGTLIDNDVAYGIPGQFEVNVGLGGAIRSSGVTAQGRTRLFTNEDFIFDFSNYVDLGGNGGGIALNSTTITQQPTLIASDLVVSAGTFAGNGGNTVRWRVETRLDDGIGKVFNKVTLESDQPLGNIRFINYLDEDVEGISDDFLYPTGTPGQADFRAFTIDDEERIGFSHGGVYASGDDLRNASYDGWAADRFSQLINAITGNGTTYTIPGNIDTNDLTPRNDPELGQIYGLADVTTAFAWSVDPNATSATITSFLELVPSDPATQVVLPGDWTGVQLQTYSNDRNVAVVVERESSSGNGAGNNDIPGSSQFLGQIAQSQFSGDENARLGFEVSGDLNRNSDVDVYSFLANGGTEVWLDIDHTQSSLDTVVELIDANGQILALSDSSLAEDADASRLFRSSVLDPGTVNPLRKSAAALAPTDSHGQTRDMFSTNPQDAGMRVVLPGGAGQATLYHIRVRSSSLLGNQPIGGLLDPAQLRMGRSQGSYHLQLRLREQDEFPGSSVSHADIRFATTGIDLSGVPRHSPLVGETAEQENRDTNRDGIVDVPNNNTFANAQELGNILATDRAAISLAGSLASPTDVDWYTFTIDYNLLLTPLAEYLSTVFDIDYADGIGRPDTSMYLFNATGGLISSGLNSNILADRAGPLRGADNGDLSRGSSGTLDAYIGPVELRAGRYFLAVTNSGNVPAVYNAYTDPNSTSPLVRLQPANNTRLIVEEHVGSTGGSTAAGPVVTDFLNSTDNVVGWTLSDMNLYVSRDVGFNATDVYIVNPFTGEMSNNVGRLNTDVRDIAFRFNGGLRAFDTSLESIQGGDLDGLSDYLNIDFGTAATTVLGATNVQTFFPNTATTTQDANVGINVEALTFGDFGSEVGFFVANRGPGPGAGDYNDNILYQFNPANGNATSAPFPRNRAVINNFDERVNGASTDVIEHGRIRTERLPTDVSQRLVVAEATLVSGGVTTPLILDGHRFTIIDSLAFSATFEFNTGPELTLRHDATTGRILRDGDQFVLDGVNYEVETGGTVVLSASNGAAVSDGATLTITDNSVAGVSRTFEFDRNGSLSNPANIRVPYTLTSTQANMVSALATAINSAGFAARADFAPGTNRISVTGKSLTVPMSVSGSGVTVEGTIGVSAGAQRINYRETMTHAELVAAMQAAMPSTVVIGFDGNRVNFSGATTGTFTQWTTRGVAINVGSSGNVSGGAIAINFLAEDTAETIAHRVALAISQSGLPGVTAVANGREVNIGNAIIDISAGRAPSAPLRAADIAPGGNVEGIAVVNGALFAVSDAGGLYRIGNPLGTFGPNGGEFSSYVTTSTDLLGIQFTGLSAGPRNLAGGRFANLLFGTDVNGTIWAFDTQGRLQPVFENGATNIATGLSGLNGLSFSTLDYNLWHVSQNRSGDAGHGQPAMPDGSRVSISGGQSWYFGFENPFTAHPNASYTAVTDPGLRNSYNFPGGAAGIMESRVFSLDGISASDSPYLYFSYLLQTQNSNSDLTDVNTFMQDSFRVYIATEDGQWEMLSTNNSDRGPGLFDDEFDAAITGTSSTQETFDNTATWRQARVNLAPYAGQSNLKLRFEFNTAGSFGLGENGGRGPEIRLLAATELQDGDTITANGQVFEIELGASLIIPSGARIRNGDFVTVQGVQFVFFNGVGTPPATGTIVNFSASESAETVASRLFAAISTATYPKTILSGFNFSNETAIQNEIIRNATSTPVNGDSMTLTGTGAIGDNPVLAATPSRDVDMIQIQLDVGSQLLVRAEAAGGSSVNTFLRLFNAAGTQLLSNDDFDDSTDSQITFTATESGIYYIGVSSALNNAYSAVVTETATAGGSTGVYSLTIDVTRQFAPTLVGSKIQLLGVKDIALSPGSAILQQGSLGVTNGNTPIRLRLDDSANEVGQAVRVALAARFASGATAAYALHDDFLNVTGLTISDAGPFALTDSKNEDLFSEYAISNPFNRPALRAQNNAFEGIYIDDILIGTAERGEVVLNAPAATTNFVANPAGGTGIQVGPYQLEIRGGQEYGRPTADAINLVRSFEVNENLASGQTIRFLSGSRIPDGASFTISDGVGSLTFEFDDVEAGNGVTAGRVAVPIRSTVIDSLTGQSRPFSAAEVAAAVRDIINSPSVQSILNITAIMINGDLTGATSSVLAINGASMIDLPTTVGVLEASASVGDSNGVREQGQIVIENSRITNSAGFAIRLRPEDRDPVSDAPSPGSVRNTVVLNSERLVPGAVIVNNELLFNRGGGINVAGETDIDNRIQGAVPFARIVNNTIVGGTIVRNDSVSAIVVDGIFFSTGTQAFADAVVSYTPLLNNGPAPIAGLQTATNALGVSDYTGFAEPVANQGVVSLGRGGQLVVRFADNDLRASGDSRPDLYVREVGDSEDVFVEVSLDGTSYRNVGKINGTVRTVDLDAFGVSPSDRIRFVRLTDDAAQGAITGDSVGADIDAIGAITSAVSESYVASGVGINVGPNASPTLLNNVVMNSTTGIVVASTSTSTVIGGTVFHRNGVNLGGSATAGQYAINVTNNRSVFVDPAEGHFYPSLNSPVIDASVDSLEDRSSLIAVKQPLGLQLSPIIAPTADINGLLRVDDPTVETPAGLGENVFKDRGAADRADFVGPTVFIINPTDNDAGNLDQNPDEGVVELLDATMRYFDIQLLDSLRPGGTTEGSGILDSSVTSSSILLYRNNVPLVEGVDYRFGYHATNGMVRLTPIAGVWSSDAVYTIRLLNKNESQIVFRSAASYSDASTFTVIGSNGVSTIFELDYGYQVQIPVNTAGVPTITDGSIFTIDDGAKRVVFEYDSNNLISAGRIRVAFDSDDTAAELATKTVVAIQGQSLNVQVASLGNGRFQLRGGRATSLLVETSGLIVTGQPGVQQAYGLQIPTQAGNPVGIQDGQNFRIQLGNGNSATFEFDSNGTIATGARRIAFSSSSTTTQIANAIVTAINGAGLGLTASNTGDGFIAIGGGSDIRITNLTSVLQIVGRPGTAASRTISVDLQNVQQTEDIAALVASAIRSANISGVTVTVFGGRILIEGAQGVVGQGASPVVAISDIAGNPIRANQLTGETLLLIQLGSGLDYGDAPDPSYRSKNERDGARHKIVEGFRLGATVTVDGDSRQVDADTDDGLVSISALYAAYSSQAVVNVQGVSATQPGFLSMWVDFDGDGEFENTDRIVIGMPVVNGNNTLPAFKTPAAAKAGETYARIRLSSTALVSAFGEANDGEVEDYKLVINANPYRNPNNNLDVSNDGFVSAIDALQVINFLNLNGPSTALVAPPNRPVPPYLDVNGDGFVTAIDSLLVINFLNARSGNGEGSGEGEGSGDTWYSAAASGSNEDSSEMVGPGAGSSAVASSSSATVQGPVVGLGEYLKSRPRAVGPVSSSSVLQDPASMVIDELLDELSSHVSSEFSPESDLSSIFDRPFWEE